MACFLGSTRYGVLGDPDVLVENADWESAEARDAHMQAAAATGRRKLSQGPVPGAALMPTFRVDRDGVLR